MKTIRKFVRSLLIIFLTACNFASPTPAAPPAGDPTSSLPQSNLTEPSAFTGEADIIFTNGEILTMDDANPRAQAIAIEGNKILAIGTNEEVLAHRGNTTNVIDLEGATITPGFIDSHQHRVLNALEGKSDMDTNLNNAIMQGWTSINELFILPEVMPQYLALNEQGKFRLRVNAFPTANTNWGAEVGTWYNEYKQSQSYPPNLRVGGLKVFTDVNNATTLLWNQSNLNAFLLARHEEGWQLAIKTVSTRSLEMILIALENIENSDPNIVNRRVRLEHALFLTPEQIARVKHLGVVPIINLNNPGQLVGEADVDELIAREPQGSYSPWRSLVEAGIHVANATGWPSYYVDEPTGAPFGSPMHLIYQAVTRVGNLGKQPYPWLLDQTITAAQAMRVLTIDGAYSSFEEDVKGSLTIGKLADIVILSDNPLTVSAPEINNIQVLMTMIDGKVEFCAVGYATLCPYAATVPSPTASSSQPDTDSVDLTSSGSLTASATLADQPPSNAVDGNPDTVWNSGDNPRQWIRFEFDAPRMILSVRLNISQFPEGYTVHRIWGGSTEENVQLLHEFAGNTTDGQILEFVSPTYLENIRILYIITTQSPSWVAWREIQVIGE